MSNPKKEASNQPKDIHTITVFVAVNEHGVFRASAVKGPKGDAVRLENVESRSLKRFRASAGLVLESVIDQVEAAWDHHMAAEAE